MKAASMIVVGLCVCLIVSCVEKQLATIQEADLCGSEKRTWVLHQEGGKPLPRPLWGFAFYKKAHFLQFFIVRTTNGKHYFQADHSINGKDLNKCFATWHIIGDTLFTADANRGRVPYLLIRKLSNKEMVYQEFIDNSRLNPSILTAISVPDTVSNMTLNCPPHYRFEATHDQVKMID